MILALAGLCYAARVYGQGEDLSATRFCGVGPGTKPPQNISVTSDESDSLSYVHFDVQGGRTLALRGVRQISALCPIAGDRIVMFGAVAGGASSAYDVAIASTAEGTLLDSWEAYTPVMSPDQRWIILRKFYAPQTSLTISEEYLLYPLWKLQSEVHNAGSQNAEPPSTATVVYPLGQTNAFMSNIGVAPEQVHVFRSRSFYWSADSRAVVFADSVQNSLGAVLILMNRENTTTLIHSLALEEVCDLLSSADLSTLTLARASVGELEDTGGREIQLRFDPGSSGCKPKTISINSSVFQAPMPERHPAQRRKPPRRCSSDSGAHPREERGLQPGATGVCRLLDLAESPAASL